MKQETLERGVWSAALWFCGWGMHDDFERRHTVDVIAVCLVFLIWLRVNVSRKDPALAQHERSQTEG